VNLVAIADIVGPGGDDGREVELQKSATHIQWRYVGETTWVNLVAIADIVGPGGDDGREVELQKSATHIQWRYVGEATWVNLVAIDDIVGPGGQGIPTGGTDGQMLVKDGLTPFLTKWVDAPSSSGDQSGLTISYTGSIFTPTVITRCPPKTIQVGDTVNNYSGKWADSISIATANTLTSISFDDLEGLVGQLPYSFPSLQTCSFPELKVFSGAFTFYSYAPLVTTLNLPKLKYLLGSFYPEGLRVPVVSFPEMVFATGSMSPINSTYITSISAPKLKMCAGAIAPYGLSNLVTLSFPSLQILGNLGPYNVPALTTIDLSALVQITGASITLNNGTAAVTNMLCPSTLTYCGGNITFTSCALSQASVDSWLIALAALDGTNGTIPYNGHAITITGTSASPSAAGLSAKAILVAAGRNNTVTHR
jgi:hypothetical protein